MLPFSDGDEMEGVEMTNGDATTSGGKSTSLKDGGSDYIGLGTVMQNATDYLSERQSADFKRWRNRIMARIEEIEVS